MKNHLLKIAVASATFTLAHPALAETSGFYAGAGFGQSKLSDWLSENDALAALNAGADAGGVSGTDVTISSDSDDSDSAWKIFGGYRVNDNFAVEASYVDLGEASAHATASGDFLVDDGSGLVATTGRFGTKATSEATALAIDAVGLLKSKHNFDVFAKVGLYYASSEIKVSAFADFDDLGSASGSESIDDNNTGLHWGVGANAWITENIGVRVEWEQFQKVEVEDAESDISLLSASVIYKF